jgi:hypothetical protein
MTTKFGSKYVGHTTPKWVLILQVILEYMFVTIAAGSLTVPDEWIWWKYVVALSGFLAGLWTKLKPYFGLVESE